MVYLKHLLSYDLPVLTPDLLISLPDNNKILIDVELIQKLVRNSFMAVFLYTIYTHIYPTVIYLVKQQIANEKQRKELEKELVILKECLSKEKENRIRLENELEISKEKRQDEIDQQSIYKGFFNNSDVVFFIKENGSLLKANAKVMKLASVNEKETAIQVLHQDIIERININDDNILSNRQTFKITEKIHIQGKEMYFYFLQFPIDSKRIGGIGFDATEKILLEQELLQKNDELEKFAYLASHDLVSPLRSIIGFSEEIELLLKRLFEMLNYLNDNTNFNQETKKMNTTELNSIKEEIDDDFARIIKAGEIMNQMLDDLLNFSRSETSKLELSTVNLEKLLDDVLNTLNTSMKNNVTIIKQVQLPTIKGDRIKLIQVFQNLLSNGIKFNKKESKTIEVLYKESTYEYIFGIKDNGIGIEPKYQKEIFNLFSRLHRQDEYQGTGLGLAICKKVVEKHKGRIWIESKMNHYSIFYFSISKYL